MLKQLSEALVSDDITIVRKALQNYIKSNAERYLRDACGMHSEFDGLSRDLIEDTREAVALYRLLGYAEKEIQQEVQDTFAEELSGKEIRRLWQRVKGADDDSTTG